MGEGGNFLKNLIFKTFRVHLEYKSVPTIDDRCRTAHNKRNVYKLHGACKLKVLAKHLLFCCGL